jgi:hypothetical protein
MDLTPLMIVAVMGLLWFLKSQLDRFRSGGGQKGKNKSKTKEQYNKYND